VTVGAPNLTHAEKKLREEFDTIDSHIPKIVNNCVAVAIISS